MSDGQPWWNYKELFRPNESEPSGWRPKPVVKALRKLCRLWASTPSVEATSLSQSRLTRKFAGIAVDGPMRRAAVVTLPVTVPRFANINTGKSITKSADGSRSSCWPLLLLLDRLLLPHPSITTEANWPLEEDQVVRLRLISVAPTVRHRKRQVPYSKTHPARLRTFTEKGLTNALTRAACTKEKKRPNILYLHF